MKTNDIEEQRELMLSDVSNILEGIDDDDITTNVDQVIIDRCVTLLERNGRFHSQLKAFVQEVLTDDHGISEEASDLLKDMLGTHPELDTVIDHLDACEGRFFLRRGYFEARENMSEQGQMKNYRFRTSLGYVYLSLDVSNFKPGTGIGNIPVMRLEEGDIDLEEGEEFIKQLYTGISRFVDKMDDGSMWVVIDLDDPYYGSPEYLLEEVSE